MDTSIRICTFRVGSLWCGVGLEHVQEIAGYLPMTPIPLAPNVVCGLLNLRGQVVTAIDLRTRLDLPTRSDMELSYNLVVKRRAGIVSLVVDEVGDVIETSRNALGIPPPTLSQRVSRFVDAVLETEARLLLTLDIDTISSMEL